MRDQTGGASDPSALKEIKASRFDRRRDPTPNNTDEPRGYAYSDSVDHLPKLEPHQLPPGREANNLFLSERTLWMMAQAKRAANALEGKAVVLNRVTNFQEMEVFRYPYM